MRTKNGGERSVGHEGPNVFTRADVNLVYSSLRYQYSFDVKGARVFLAVGCVLVVVGAAWLFLFDSKQPESVMAEDGSVQAPEPGSGTADTAAPPAPAAAEDGGPDRPTEVVLFAPWGGGPGDLGRKAPEEGAPEGPMSFLVSADGRVFVLDQVNRRVQVFEDGKIVRQLDIPGDTFQDVALDPNGRVVLLDRLAQKSLVFLDPEQRVALEGPGVLEGGGVTGLFVQEDGAWVEVEHQKLVRIADAAGRADPERPWVPGRHSMDGAWLLLAAREGRQAATVSVQAVGEPGASFKTIARVGFPMTVLHLTALESDPDGRIYLGARLEKAELLVILASDGSELARIALPVSRLALEQFRSIRMGQDGIIYHLHCADPGATLRRIVW